MEGRSKLSTMDKEPLMPNASKHLIELETRFWQSILDQQTDVALELLDEPALMVSAHGPMKFDHAGYRKMAEHGSMILKSFEFSDMEAHFPDDTTAIVTYRVRQRLARRDDNGTTTQEMADTSTWIRKGGQWKCVMHTETSMDR